MNAQSMDDLREFHRFVGEKVKSNNTDMRPEDVLDEWRALHPMECDADGLTEEDYEAIQEAIDDIENGHQGTPFEEFDREFRLRHNIGDPS